MTDREMLEMAARSISIVGKYVTHYDNGEYQYSGETEGIAYIREDRREVVWNPLSDDGDALRLAVKLKLYVDWSSPNDNMVYVTGCAEQLDDDQYAAIRRAIVRAAAEIGEGVIE